MQPSPAWDFRWPLESRHFVSYLIKVSFRGRVNFNMRHQGHRFDVTANGLS